VIARSAILPSVDFNASVGVTRQGAGNLIIQGESFPQGASVYSTGHAGLAVRQLIFDGGKWWNNMSAANLGLEATQAQVDEQRLQITYLVEQRFYELVRAQRQLQSSAMPRSGAATRQITRCGCRGRPGHPGRRFTPRAQTGTTTRCSGSARNAPSSWRAPTSRPPSDSIRELR